MKQSRKQKWRWLRYRKNDLAHNVQVAVQRWVHANGGTAVVMSGVQFIRMPGERELNYHVAIHCTGRQPTMKEKS